MEKTIEKPRIKAGNLGAAKSFDYVVTSALFLIFFLVPMFFTGMASQGIAFEKMTLFYFLVLVGLVAWVSQGVILGELQFKRTPLDLPIVGLILVFIISTILSVSQKDGLIGAYGSSAKGLAGLLAFVMFYYLLVNNINAKRIKLFFWSFIVSSSIVSVLSFLQIVGWYVIPIAVTKVSSFNPLGSLSSLTAFILISLPLLVIAASQIQELRESKNKSSNLVIKIVLGILILLDLIILTLLSGFTFWPAALVGAVIILMFLLAKIIKTESNDMIIPVAVFLLMIVQLVLGSFNFVKLNLPTEVSLSRTASWQIAKSSIAKDPLFGSGPSTFYYAFSKYKNPDFNQTILWNARFDSASGTLFEFMATVGALGAVALVVIVLIALSIIFIALIKATKKDAQLKLLGLFASFVVIILIALMLPVNGSIIITSIILSALAVAVTVEIYPEKFKVLNLSFRASAKYALALSAIFLTVSAGVVVVFTMGFKLYLADIYAQRALAQTDQTQKIDTLNKAITLAPYQDKYYLEIANTYLGLANQEAAGKADQAIIGNYLSQAIDSGKKAVDLSPNSAANNESLALVYENASFYVRGALEWAENLYKTDAELDPQNPTPIIRMALINVARANLTEDAKEKETYLNEAIKKYQEAITLKSDLAAAYYGQAIAYEKMNKTNEGIEQLKKASVLDGNNLDYRFELGRMLFNRGIVKPSINQNATTDITTGQPDQGLSVSPQGAGGNVTRNDDLTNAEQIFLNILSVNANHANSLYSLALLYQKIGESDNARTAVTKLLEILPEDATKEAVKKQFIGLY